MGSAKQVDAAVAAEQFIIRDEVHEPMHDRFLWAVMQRRDWEAAATPEWEELREIASKIKEHTLTHLDRYVEEFEAKCHKTRRARALGDGCRRAQ
jgi:L-lactate dehydrogenase complex protein LldF